MQRLLAVMFCAAILFSFAGCAEQKDPSNGPASGEARVRLADFFAGAPPIDVWVDGVCRVENIHYLTVSSYLAISSEQHLVQIAVAGSVPPSVLYEDQYQVPDNSAITVASAGLMPKLNMFTYTDNLTTDPNQAKLRFIPLSPDAGDMDMDVAGGPQIGSGIVYSGSSSYRSVAPGTYDLLVHIAGTNTTILHVNDYPLIAGHNYTLFMSGSRVNHTVEGTIAVDAAAE